MSKSVIVVVVFVLFQLFQKSSGADYTACSAEKRKEFDDEDDICGSITRSNKPLDTDNPIFVGCHNYTGTQYSVPRICTVNYVNDAGLYENSKYNGGNTPPPNPNASKCKPVTSNKDDCYKSCVNGWTSYTVFIATYNLSKHKVYKCKPDKTTYCTCVTIANRKAGN